ncbi:hypothetical protein M896_060390 [Ordospora colligata OC4]|uniref:Peptidase M12B domain-containing protein n=1 Tax=Ordospora colligata OC4 TaxID=1354746 RepID=A0A0B2UEM6_9MICR|nr:uncharacterized protein M896_060390 [Ordospora colligata OC4]KHN69541.1 hypothetical protein M896_060390 [Ordospora colligata OC4]TBU15361.1 hypothetical protein CWI41_060380 [Ordospora colligata]
MQMILVFIAIAICITENVSVDFRTPDGQILLPERIPSTPVLFMEFKAFSRKFRLMLNDSSHCINGITMKKSLCDFSISSQSQDDCYGSLSFCGEISGKFILGQYIYNIRSTMASHIHISQVEYPVSNPNKINELISTVSTAKVTSDTQKRLPIFLINDFERVQEVGPSINQDTMQMFNISKKILEKNKWKRYNINLKLNGILNVVHSPLNVRQTNVPWAQTISEDHTEGLEQFDNIRMLKTFSDMFRSIDNKEDMMGKLMDQAGLIVLLQPSGSIVSGLTFSNGFGSSDRRFSIVRISGTDSYFHQGKVLAHEIAHSIGANHELGTKCLMKPEDSPVDNDEDAFLSNKAIDAMEHFLYKNKIRTDTINTCGNGLIDDDKECDSGLYAGSLCCTNRCRLRSGELCSN